MPLHVTAIFIVLLSSLLGTLLPIITRSVPLLRENPFIFVLAKTAATGVLLAVSTIHLIGEAVETLNEPCVPQSLQHFYGPYGFFLVVLAALIMHAVDFKLDEIAKGWLKQQSQSQTSAEGKVGCQENYGTLSEAGETIHKEDESSPECGHHHGGVLPPTSMVQLHRVISAISLEFGVTLHSIFVGLNMGLTMDSSLKPLLVALVFHQLFEGMALGSRLAEAKLSRLWDIVLVMIFSVGGPLGMTISTVAVSIRRDAMTGGWFALMLGSLGSFCGGILLYLAFSLLFSDFSRDVKAHCSDNMPRKTIKKIAMFVSLWTGMLLMAIIGKWL
ncbi:unnamed protein product [Phytomonas sp. Hart1]|nr:unnamed protein product [Phytomonas sp. Hart1]|eukprot:CCW71979.1 unnamed protein product [Phytomonas sp. isolate Hart1]